MNNKEENIETGLSNLKLKTLCGLMILITVIVLIGLQSRLTLITLIMVIFWTLGVYYILKDVTNINDVLFRKFFYWGIYFLLLGLFFEPYEGGIKKDHPTLSYYFVTVGLAIFSLIAFMIIIDVLKQGKYLDILVANGQNPMVGYYGIGGIIKLNGY
jgi:predicted acyltransferase